MAHPAAAEVLLFTFSGTAADNYVPADVVVAAGASKADVLMAYYREMQAAVPPGAMLAVRPTPDAPDSSLRRVPGAMAADVKKYLTDFYPKGLLEPLLPPSGVAGSGSAAAAEKPAQAARAPAPSPPEAKRARVGDAAGVGDVEWYEVLAPSKQKPLKPPAPSVAAHGEGVAAGPSPPLARQTRATPATAAQLTTTLLEKPKACGSAPALSPRRSRTATAASEGGAGGSQAAEAASVGGALVLTLARTTQKFSSWAALQPALQDGDLVTVQGKLQGPVHVRRRGLTLRGTSDSCRFVLLAPPDENTTLSLDADSITIRFADIHATSHVSLKCAPSTVNVSPGRKLCRLESCNVNGAGTPLHHKGRWYGNVGVEVGDNADCTLAIVNILNVSGSGACVRSRATAIMQRVTVLDAGGTAFWLRAAGLCLFVDCLARRPALDGFNIDALEPAVLTRCRVEDCGNNGATFDFPRTVLGKELCDAMLCAATEALLARIAHSAQDLVCLRSSNNGVLVDGGVAVDLTNSRLIESQLNGLLITDTVLPGAVARITIAGAEISDNGHGKEAKKAQGECSGIALEKSAVTGTSRIAVMQPQPPWKGVQLHGNRDSPHVEVAL